MNTDLSLDFSLKKEIYSKGVLLRVAYHFLDDYYVFLDADADNWKISIKVKEAHQKMDITALQADFENRLINEEFRENLLENTKATKQLIVSRALFGATYADLQPSQPAPKKVFNEKEFFENEELDDYVEDPLQISVTWEERFAKNKNGAASGEKEDDSSA